MNGAAVPCRTSLRATVTQVRKSWAGKGGEAWFTNVGKYLSHDDAISCTNHCCTARARFEDFSVVATTAQPRGFIYPRLRVALFFSLALPKVLTKTRRGKVVGKVIVYISGMRGRGSSFCRA